MPDQTEPNLKWNFREWTKRCTIIRTVTGGSLEAQMLTLWTWALSGNWWYSGLLGFGSPGYWGRNFAVRSPALSYGELPLGAVDRFGIHQYRSMFGSHYSVEDLKFHPLVIKGYEAFAQGSQYNGLETCY